MILVLHYISYNFRWSQWFWFCNIILRLMSVTCLLRLTGSRRGEWWSWSDIWLTKHFDHHNDLPDQICDPDQEPTAVWILLGVLCNRIHGRSALQGGDDHLLIMCTDSNINEYEMWDIYIYQSIDEKDINTNTKKTLRRPLASWSPCPSRTWWTAATPRATWAAMEGWWTRWDRLLDSI